MLKAYVPALTLLVPIALALMACATSRSQPTASPFQWSEHAGIWASSGYGYVVDTRHGGIHLYHVTDTVCIENPAGALSAVDFFDLYHQPDALTLRLHSTLDPFVFTFQRMNDLPAHCAKATPATALHNFDAFASYFATHYAFFDLYGVDWPAQTERVRKQLRDDSQDALLFQSMRELLGPLKDSHIKLEAQVDGQQRVHDGNPGKTDLAVGTWAERSGIDAREAVGQFRRAYWFDDIRDTLLEGAGTITGNGRIQYGMLGHDRRIGYIAVVSMGGFVSGEVDTAHQELTALDAAMEEALALFAQQQARAVILDLSLNTGGYDFVGLAIAGRFASEQRIAYHRRAGDDPNARDFPIHVQPASGRRFTGPAYVLTSDLTKSAGEIGTLAMRALPQVTHVGEHTRGAFSTILTKHLRNGWVLSLSNEIYTDPAGVVWEGQGITPTRQIPVFDQRNPLTGHVEAVRHIIRLIDTGS